MDKKSLRRTASFSFSEDTLKKFDSYCSKGRINRSRLVEDLLVEFLNRGHTPKQTTEAPNAVS